MKRTKIYLRSPIGVITIIHTAKGISNIDLDRTTNENAEIKNHSIGDINLEVVSCEGNWTPVSDEILSWFKQFFSRKSDGIIPLTVDSDIVEADNFTGRVLRNLMKVPAGKTVSYAKLAEISGNSKACRAVGQAMRKNPLPLLVPCHRVISSSGNVGNYMSGAGNNIKSWLLYFENADIKISK